MLKHRILWVYSIFWGKVSTWREPLGMFTYSFFLENNGFVKSTKYLESSLIKSCSIGYYSIKSKIYSQMKITHLNSAGKPIENSPLQLFRQPNYFQSQQDFLFSKCGSYQQQGRT
jgi:hypothetical protein